MRKIVIIIALGLISTTQSITVNADRPLAKRKQPVESKVASSTDESLLELIRRAQETAENAQAESRRAREQNEALQRELERMAQELVSLRQALGDAKIADCGLRIAELEKHLNRLQTAVSKESSPRVAAATDSSDTQTASLDARSPTKDPALDPQLEDRLAKIEEQVDISASQIKEHAQTKVESESRFRLRLFGIILANTYLNSNDSSLKDEPLYAEPQPIGARGRTNNLGATLRQTKIGLAMTGPRIGNARMSAEVETDFWGGTQGKADGDVLGFFRLRTATARLDWDNTSIEIGQRGPIISPYDPNSIAAVWFPPLSGAGNLWQWRPQFVVEHRRQMGEGSDLILQGSFMPTFGERLGTAVLEGPPSFESRIAFRRKLASGRSYEFGVGGHFGNRPFGFDRNVGAHVVAGDWRVPIGDRFELSGEAYHGRSVSLSEYSGGRIDRLFAINGPIDDPRTLIRGVSSSGGWLQLNAQVRRDLELNIAYGQEDPSNRDIRSASFDDLTRFKNQVGFANFIYHMRSNFLISFEYRRLLTDYSTRRFTNNHYNLAFGYLF